MKRKFIRSQKKGVRNVRRLRGNLSGLLLLVLIFSGLHPGKAQSGTRCFTSATYPAVYAKSEWVTNGDTVTIRTTLSRGFVDNTYGTGAIGWSNGHKFSDLTGSDYLQLSLFNNANTKILEFKMDYFSASTAAPSGYKSLGVTGGDGGMVFGTATNVYGVTTSMDANFNNFGYVLTTNSPATDTSYSTNATYPNWIYSVWYEVKVKKSAFGTSGFFQPTVTGVHASPSKVGTNSVAVTPNPCPVGSIGNFVWFDTDQDGVQDAGEPGVSGITVKLFDCSSNALLSTTTTNASGAYLFSNLEIEKSYYLVFDPTSLPAGYQFTTKDQGSNNGTDSDADPVSGQTVCEYLTANENNLTYDAGVINPTTAAIGNFVWSDLDEDGIQDAGEPGVNGVTVQLYTCADVLVSTTTTTSTGAYNFAGLAPGNYYVRFVLPSGSRFTQKNSGSNNALDSDADTITGKTACENLVAGENNTTYDAGIISPVAGEACFISTSLPGVAFAKTVWYSVGDTIVFRTTLSRRFVDNTYGTNAIGWSNGHKFSNLTGSDNLQLALYNNSNTKVLEFKQDYITSTSTVPSGFRSLGVSGGDGGMILGSATNILGASSSLDENFNKFGYILTTNSPATDTNYTANPTYPNWEYTVWYEIKVRKSAFGTSGFSYPMITGIHASPSKVGSNTVPVTPGPCPVGSIGDLVWRDNNNNGIQDTGEPGVPGVTVRLYNCLGNALVGTTTTDANGNYLFSNLTVDVAYYVVFDLTTAPAGAIFSQKDQGTNDTKDSDADPSTGRTVCETITANENNLTYDAGIYVPPSSALGNFVWFDQDGDGIQDPGEPGVSGVKVRLYSCAGVLLDSTLTDANGLYLFDSLTAGSYFVEFVTPSGFTLSPQAAGGNDALDSDANPANGRTNCVTLGQGETNLNVDAGLVCIPPTPSISGTRNFCPGGSTTLDAGAGFTAYLWSNGATTRTISVSTAGTWTVTVTNSVGCTASVSATTTIFIPPTCSITGAAAICAGGSASWCAPTGMSSYLWSNGATTRCVTLTTAGSYTVTITDANGCTSSCSQTLTVNNNPVCSITGNTTICSGTTANWCAPTGMSSYQWSTGATTRCINVNTAGTYTVTITDANGCSSSCSQTLTVNTNPVCSITGNTTICSGNTANWCAPTGMSAYLWSNGATTRCVNLTTAGTYTVTITDANGCTSSCSQTLTVNQNPVCSITGTTAICDGNSTSWCAPSGMSSYLWSTGATTRCITLSTAGTYTVTITNANGCTSSCSQTLTVNPNPVCSITGNTTICSGASASWCAPAGMSAYQWSTGATTQCITLTTAGTYTVTITNANGCTSTCSQTLTVNPNPTCSITGPSSVCAGGSATLCAPAGLIAYQWSNGATTRCISVTTSGTYTVTITDANGCTSSCNKIFTVNPNPTCSITGPASVCAGGSATWCAPAGMSAYQWSTGATTRCINVSTSGTYTVTITDANGCTSSCSQSFTVNPNPVCSITGPATVCAGGSATWCAPSGMSAYQWSTGATTRCINLTTSGTYTVTITDANGCTSSCSQIFTVNPNPICSITGSASICSGGSATWCATAGMSAYQWSNGATTRCISVSTSGTYTVTITDANGCTSSCSQIFTVNPNPVCSITGPASVCAGGSATWCAPAGMSAYQWSTGATTRCINVSISGTYTVTITDANGCTSSCSQTFTVNPAPVCSITGPASVCAGGSVTWCAPAGMSAYQWNTGATTRCINVSTSGTYTVTITDANGCSSSCSQTFTANQAPVCSITGPASVCSGGSATWCATAGMSSYLWSTGATTRCVNLSTSGTYTVTITDASGCTSSCSQTFTVNQAPVCSITGPAAVCAGGSATWCATAGMSSYLWSTGATTRCVTVSASGTYTVTITDANGCTSSCNQTFTVNPAPACSITGPASVCAGGNANWCAPAGMSSYLWSTGATTRCITLTSAGTYTVTITDANGCTSSCSQTFTVNQAPVCSITGPAAICPGGSASWCAPAGMSSYLWSTGATTRCVTLTAAGTYTVTITDANGCTSSCSQNLTVNTAPACSITGPAAVCAGGSATWCAPSGMSSYLWSTGATTRCITLNIAGTYIVTITDANGCSSTCSQTFSIYQAPTCSISGPSSICTGASATWCAPAGMSSYLWSTGATTQCVTVNTAGTYTVTITDANGCSSTCSGTLTVNSKPVPVIAGSKHFCTGSSSVLDAGAGYSSYLWSTGATTRTITVTTAATWTVTVTNAAGCTGTATATTSLKTRPVPSIVSKNSFCAGGSMVLSANATYTTYLWSTGATTASITITTGGTYTLTVTNSSGCSGQASKTITVNPRPTCSITGTTVISPGQSTTLCAPLSMVTYLWNTGATTRCITVGKPGTFTVTITNSNGCTNSCSVTVSQGAKVGDATSDNTGLDVNIYPNPMNESATIEYINMGSTGTGTILLFNVTGEKVMDIYQGEMAQGEMQTVTIDGTKMAPGVYICRISVGNQIITRRIVINR